MIRRMSWNHSLIVQIIGVKIIVNIFILIVGYIITFFIVFPFVFTALIYYINKMLGVHPLKAFHRSMAWSTILYIVAVIQMLSLSFERLFIGGIICLFILSLAVIMIVQHRRGVDIHLKTASRIVWRICFLLFVGLYMILVLYGIIIRL